MFLLPARNGGRKKKREIAGERPASGMHPLWGGGDAYSGDDGTLVWAALMGGCVGDGDVWKCGRRWQDVAWLVHRRGGGAEG